MLNEGKVKNAGRTSDNSSFLIPHSSLSAASRSPSTHSSISGALRGRQLWWVERAAAWWQTRLPLVRRPALATFG
jgi:hypothetical protein